MEVKVNKEKCFGCSACCAIVPNVFTMDDDGLAEVIENAMIEDNKEDIKIAAENCPNEAIEISE